MNCVKQIFFLFKILQKLQIIKKYKFIDNNNRNIVYFMISIYKSGDIMEKEKITELVNLVKEKDDRAFLKLYKEYYKSIYTYAYFLCNRNECDAEEVVQETFAKAWKYIDQLNNPSLFPYWLRQITANQAKILFTKNRDWIISPDKLIKIPVIEKKEDYNPKLKVNNMTDKQIIHTLIKNLPIKHQEVIHLFYFQQYSLEEIKEILQVPIGTVKSRIYTARNLLKIEIKKFEERESRTINFNMEYVFPGIITLIILKLNKGKLQFAQVATSGLLVFSSVSIFHDIYNQIPISSANENIAIEFQPIDYKGNRIETLEEAFFTIKKEAPTAEDITALSDKDIKELSKVVEAVNESNSNYIDILKHSSWIDTFYKYLKKI